MTEKVALQRTSNGLLDDVVVNDVSVFRADGYGCGHRVIFRVNLSQRSRKGTIAMTAPQILDPARMLGQALSDASPDLMRHLLSSVINALLSAYRSFLERSVP